MRRRFLSAAVLAIVGAVALGACADDAGGPDDSPSSSATGSTTTTSMPGTTTTSPATGDSAPAPTVAAPPTSAPDPGRSDRAIGFGRAATGGDEPCVVTTLDDSGPGTLRGCAEAGGKLVTFAVSGELEVDDHVDVASDTTIDGAGQDVTIVGMLDVKEVENVIIRHLTIAGGEPDAIRVLRSHTAWFDHLDLSDSADGLIDVTDGSTDVTISWSHFHDHDKMVLVNPNADTGMRARVTLHHNWFDNGGRRYPSSEISDIHGFNNYMDGWSNYGVLATESSRYLSEHNVFRSSGDENALLTTFGEEAPGEAVSVDDRFFGEVEVQLRGDAFVPSYDYSLDPTDEVVDLVTTATGPNR